MNKKKEEKTMEIVIEKYTIEQIIKSKKYNRYKDMLTAILKDSKQYDTKEVDEKIEEFLKRKVK